MIRSGSDGGIEVTKPDNKSCRNYGEGEGVKNCGRWFPMCSYTYPSAYLRRVWIKIMRISPCITTIEPCAIEVRTSDLPTWTPFLHDVIERAVSSILYHTRLIFTVSNVNCHILKLR